MNEQLGLKKMKTTSENWKLRLINSKKCLQMLTKGFLLLCSLTVVSCSTGPSVRQDQADKGEWEARVLVKNRKQAKSFLVNVDFVAVRPGKMRMDVTTPVGMHVASIALNDAVMTFVVPRKKAYYEGRATAQSFAKTLNFSFDPKLMMNILFDRPVQHKGWTCKSQDEVVSECSQGAFKIVWSNRTQKDKTVRVIHPQYQIELKFHNFNVPKSVKDELFTIHQPDGFNKLK
jgi:hypothetical protein